jgi:hypothetical protein
MCGASILVDLSARCERGGQRIFLAALDWYCGMVARERIDSTVHKAHLLDVVAGGDGVGCRAPDRCGALESADSLTPWHNAVGRPSNPPVQEHVEDARANRTVMGWM